MALPHGASREASHQSARARASILCSHVWSGAQLNKGDKNAVEYNAVQRAHANHSEAALFMVPITLIVAPLAPATVMVLSLLWCWGKFLMNYTYATAVDTSKRFVIGGWSYVPYFFLQVLLALSPSVHPPSAPPPLPLSSMHAHIRLHACRVCTMGQCICVSVHLIANASKRPCCTSIGLHLAGSSVKARLHQAGLSAIGLSFITGVVSVVFTPVFCRPPSSAPGIPHLDKALQGSIEILSQERAVWAAHFRAYV